MDRRAGARRWTAVAFALVLLAAGAGCSKNDDDPVVVTVDGLAMTESDVLRSYIDYLITTGQNDSRALRQRHVEALIDAYLLGAEAERRGLAADSALRAEALLAERKLVGARFYEASVIDTMAAPSEAEVQRAYALGEERRVVRQLYYTDPAKAEAAYRRLEAGRPFLDEAQELYGVADSTAGSLGVVGYWELDDAFAEVAFSTPVGRYSTPVRTRLGTHIIFVDDRIRNPILTEDAYTRGRKGADSQLRLRTRRLKGDAFVRDFMEASNVAVNRPALVALQQAIKDLQGDPLPDAQQGGTKPFTVSERSEVLAAFRPETPLATFTLDGEEQTFTLADYVFWLDALPSSEARDRTGASLGRALRNEAFARAGEADGVDERPEVEHELARLQRLRLADALRTRLRRETSADTARLERVASELQLASQRTVADFWAVSFETRAAAEAALPSLKASPARASSLPGFKTYRGQGLREVPSLAAAVRAAPLGEPVLASAGDGRWAVVQVSGRRREAGGSGAQTVAPFVAEADLLRRLRQERPIKINDEALRRVTTPSVVPQARR